MIPSHCGQRGAPPKLTGPTVSNLVSWGPNMSPSRTRNRGLRRTSEAMGKPLQHVLATVDLAQQLHELRRRCIAVVLEPLDDFLIHLAVPFLIAAVRLLVLRPSLEPLIPRFIEPMEGLVSLQLFGDGSGDDVVVL